MVQSTDNLSRRQIENALVEITFPLTHTVGPLEVPYNIYTFPLDTFQNLILCCGCAHEPPSTNGSTCVALPLEPHRLDGTNWLPERRPHPDTLGLGQAACHSGNHYNHDRICVGVGFSSWDLQARSRHDWCWGLARASSMCLGQENLSDQHWTQTSRSSHPACTKKQG